MGRWAKAELEEAFEAYQATVRRCVAASDWSHFADLFTPDATYDEHAYGRFEGREAIRSWVVRTMSAFPGSAMTSFPPRWHVVDEERGWVVCDIRNLMPDPGDGSVHEASNLTVLHYAGDGRWSHEEDAYNPMRFLTMALDWCAVAAEHDRLTPGAQEFLARYAKPSR